MLRRAAAVALVALAAAAGAAPSAGAAELILGAHSSLSGRYAKGGTAFYRGGEIAVELFNKAGGKHTVKWIGVDDQSDPAKAVAAVEKLLADRAAAIYGGYGTNIVGPASEAAERGGAVYATAGAIADVLTQRGLKGFFRFTNGQGYATPVIELLAELPVTSVAILTIKKEATVSSSKIIIPALKARGRTVTEHLFDDGVSDFQPLINRIKALDKPDVIFINAYENDILGILRAAQVVRPGVKLIVSSFGLANENMARNHPDLVKNTVGTALLPFPLKFAGSEGDAFDRAFRARYSGEPDYLALWGYATIKVLIEGMAAAANEGKVDLAGIARHLRAAPARETLAGPCRFDDKGENVLFALRMGQHQDGRVELVWPKAAATAPLRFPALPW